MSDPTAKPLWLQRNCGGHQPLSRPELVPVLVLTCAGLPPCAAVLGPSSDVVQEGAAEKPLVQLCLQGADAEPDAPQPPLAADLQGQRERQGQLCQARVILCTGDTARSTQGVTHCPPSGGCRWAQNSAQHLAASPSLRGTLEQVPRVSQKARARAPSVEFLPPALTSWLLRRTLLFTFVRLTSHVRLGRAENRRRM